MIYVPARVSPGLMDTELLRYALRTDGTGGFIFVNHYQRRTKLKDVGQAVFELESWANRGKGESLQKIRFPAVDIRGEVSFFFPYKMNLAGAELTWATAQPICREGDTFFFLEVPGIEPVYCFGEEEFSVKAGREAFKVPGKKISIVTLSLSDARFLRCLDGKLYLGEGCDLYLEDGALRSVEAGEQKAFVWEERAFRSRQVRAEEAGGEEIPVLFSESRDGRENLESFLKTESEKVSESGIRTDPACLAEKTDLISDVDRQLSRTGRDSTSACILTKLTTPPFLLTGPALEELRLSGSVAPTWYRLTVPDPYGFVSLDLPCDIMQLYTDGVLTADDFYHSVPWRLPKKLLFGKECYIVTTTTEQKIYLER